MLFAARKFLFLEKFHFWCPSKLAEYITKEIDKRFWYVVDKRRFSKLNLNLVSWRVHEDHSHFGVVRSNTSAQPQISLILQELAITHRKELTSIQQKPAAELQTLEY